MGRVGAGAQAVAHLRLVQRGQVLLGHLLHEHAVVALRRHARVRKADDGAKLVHAQVALPAAAFAARRRGLLLMHHIETHTSSLHCYPAATLLSSRQVTDGASLWPKQALCETLQLTDALGVAIWTC